MKVWNKILIKKKNGTKNIVSHFYTCLNFVYSMINKADAIKNHWDISDDYFWSEEQNSAREGLLQRAPRAAHWSVRIARHQLVLVPNTLSAHRNEKHAVYIANLVFFSLKWLYRTFTVRAYLLRFSVLFDIDIESLTLFWSMRPQVDRSAVYDIVIGSPVVKCQARDKLCLYAESRHSFHLIKLNMQCNVNICITLRAHNTT